MKISNVDEQAEVVRILENILNKQDDVISNCENVLEQVELMKKSILAKAFRGELGTNNPAEENAVELLKSILGQEE
ncbi:MAG: restriction endonuclease subunit S [Agathobacter sp.]|nr:restriction endonuclease subunit S [Agathobacter sp.]